MDLCLFEIIAEEIAHLQFVIRRSEIKYLYKDTDYS